MHEYVFTWYNLKDPDKTATLTSFRDDPEQDSDGTNPSAPARGSMRGINRFFGNTYEPDSFADEIIRYMREKDLSSKDFYERAFIDRKLLHKVINDPDYHPSKKTAFNLCLALRLEYDEAVLLLEKANYSFARNKRYDLIYAFALKEHAYDIDEINEVLDYFHLPCIGS